MLCHTIPFPGLPSAALVETSPVHWVTSRHVCVYGCSQLRELWFNDLLLYMSMYIVCARHSDLESQLMH